MYALQTNAQRFFLFAVGYDGIFVLFIQEGDWTAGLQNQLLIFHLNEPLIPNASVIGSTATASVCVCVCLISELGASSFFQYRGLAII